MKLALTITIGLLLTTLTLVPTSSAIGGCVFTHGNGAIDETQAAAVAARNGDTQRTASSGLNATLWVAFAPFCIV